MESPYTPQEREKLNQLHELLKNADDAVTKRQRAMWRKQVLAIERDARQPQYHGDYDREWSFCPL